jgi:glutamate--cysteine ligase
MTTPTSPLTRDALVQAYQSYGRPRDQWLVGAELERHLLGADGWPAPYAGEHGVRWLMERLVEEGWSPKFEGDNPIALLKDGASVTLEPGGQFELSGKPHATLQGVHDEATTFANDVARLLEPTQYRQSALGFTPFARVPEIGWVPKGRYAIMRDHMALSGELGHHMMKGTCATQASFDFEGEADCRDKVQLTIQTAPLVTALFANSPITEGRVNGWQSFRGYIWTRTDPARTGFPEAASAFSFERWVDYLLDVPMMFIRPGGVWQPARGLTFRRWMTEGDANGERPTWDDWDLHQTSVFPEVRVKQLIEMRMADCVSVPEVTSFSALFAGLVYGAAGTAAALDFTDRFTRAGTQAERFLLACREGLGGVHDGRSMASWAEELVQLAADGLAAWHPQEAHLLAPLAARAARGETPADQLLRALAGDVTPARVVAATSPLG